MKFVQFFKLATVCCTFTLLAMGCNESEPKTETQATVSEAAQPTEPAVAKPDMAKIKAEIQELENSWAAADNARDVAALAAFYADDAISLSNNQPMISGKDAISKDLTASLAKREKGATVTYEVMDVYGDENTVTEVGKSTMKDASGKVSNTGKYIAIWEKRNGKYICVRDIYNDDAPKK